MNKEILETVDYDQFTDITANREVNQLHVKRLTEAIRQQNLLHLNPIIVTSKMEVVDGQHRLESARALKVPIYYMVDDHISKADIARLNSNKKNWGPMDYINYYTIEGNPDFMKLSHLIVDYPNIRPTTLIQMVSSNPANRQLDYKEGHLDMSCEETAREVLHLADKLRNMRYDFAYDGRMMLALRHCIDTGLFDKMRFLTKIENDRMAFYKVARMSDYIKLIEEIYNRGLHSSNRVRFIKH